MGIAAGVLAMGLAVFEVELLMGRPPRLGFTPEQVTATASEFLAFLTLLKVAVDHAYLWLGAALGVALAAAIAVSSFVAPDRGPYP